MKVYARKRGRIWYGWWWMGHGKKRKKGLKSLKTSLLLEVPKKLKELKKELEAKNKGLPLESSWESFCKKYLEWSFTNKTEESYKRDKGLIKQFNRIITIKNVEDMEHYNLERFKTERKRDGVSESTINRDLGTLKNMSKYAVQIKQLKEDPWLAVQKFTLDISSPETFTGKESSIRKACKTDYERVICDLGLYQGLRRGEMRNIMWEDVDFKTGMLKVVCTMGRRTKTKKERLIPLHQKTIKSLQKLSKSSGNGFVLGFNGKQAVADRLTTVFKNILTRSGMEGHLHLTRHTLGTNLDKKNVDMRTIMDIMGHDRSKTTEIYLHTNQEAKRRAINTLG